MKSTDFIPFLLLLSISFGVGHGADNKFQIVTDDDGDGFFKFNRFWGKGEKLICYPSRAEPAVGTYAKLSKRFVKENSMVGENLVDECKELVPDDKKDTMWSGMKVNWFDGKMAEIKTSYGTKCTISGPLVVQFFFIRLTDGALYGKEKEDGPLVPLNCISAGLNNGEKGGQFAAEQVDGAFLEDYIDLWFIGIDLGNGTSLFATTTPRIVNISDKAWECKRFEENVKPAFIAKDGKRPAEHVVRIGYVHNINGSSFPFNEGVSNPFEQIYADLEKEEAFQIGLAAIDLAPDEMRNFLHKYQDFFYMKIPSELVNKGGVVRMVFHKCDDITLGVFVKKSDADATEVEDPRNDWSKDFAQLKCKRIRLMRIDEDEHSHQYKLPFSDDTEWLRIKAEVDLPVRIGITAKAGRFPNYAQLEAHRYFYGHRNMPRHSIREHLLEDLDNYDRSRNWGRYLTGYDEFYKPAKEHSLIVIYKKLTYVLLTDYVYIKEENAGHIYVQPELTQECYDCAEGNYQIYTSRFQAVQNTDVNVDGVLKHLRFPNNTHRLILDNDNYEYTIDPSKMFLKKIVPDGRK